MKISLLELPLYFLIPYLSYSISSWVIRSFSTFSTLLIHSHGNEQYLGLIHKSDIYKDISIGDRLKGVVKKVRNDNKLDIVLSQIGYKSIEPNADAVMKILDDNSGYLDLTDKSSPELIKEQLEMSKKSFKKAIGTLYKQRLIDIKDDGIYRL